MRMVALAAKVHHQVKCMYCVVYDVNCMVVYPLGGEIVHVNVANGETELLCAITEHDYHTTENLL